MNINNSKKSKATSPRIILLGGVYGVGKTSLAHQLSIELNIFQRAGLGAITKTVKTILPENKIVKEWGEYKSPKLELIEEKFLRECELIGRVVNTLVKSACTTGEDYIVDGVQLLPQFLPLDKIYFGIITVSDYSEYQKRFEHPTLTRVRHLNNATTEIAKNIEQVILKEAKKLNIPIFDNLKPIKETSKEIRNHFGL